MNDVLRLADVLALFDSYVDEDATRLPVVKGLRQRVLNLAFPSEPVPPPAPEPYDRDNPGCICPELSPAVCTIHRRLMRPWEQAIEFGKSSTVLT